MFDPLGPIWTPDPVVREHPLNVGRVGWWLTLPTLSGGSKWYDLLGRNPGTLAGMTDPVASGWRATTRPGGWGHLHYTGGESVDVPSSTAFDLTSTLTLSCWVRPANFSTYRGLISRTSGSTPAPWDWYLALGNGFPTFYGTGAAVGSTGPVAGAWTHLAVTSAPGGVQHYLNGNLNGFTSGVIPRAAEAVAVKFGNRPDGVTLLIGDLDDAGIWNRALSAAEVRALYDESRAGYPATLRRLTSRSVVLMGGTAPAVKVPRPLFSQRSV